MSRFKQHKNKLTEPNMNRKPFEEFKSNLGSREGTKDTSKEENKSAPVVFDENGQGSFIFDNIPSPEEIKYQNHQKELEVKARYREALKPYIGSYIYVAAKTHPIGQVTCVSPLSKGIVGQSNKLRFASKVIKRFEPEPNKKYSDGTSTMQDYEKMYVLKNDHVFCTIEKEDMIYDTEETQKMREIFRNYYKEINALY